jgi:hypothetical protein
MRETTVFTTVRGIPAWLLRDYLTELGGRTQDDDSVVGPGWRARLTQADDYALGSVRVGQVHLELHGQAGTVEQIRRALEPKLLRGGG